MAGVRRLRPGEVPGPVLPFADRVRLLQLGEPGRRARRVAGRGGELSPVEVPPERQVGRAACEKQRAAVLEGDGQHARPAAGGELERIAHGGHLQRPGAQPALAVPHRAGRVLDRLALAVSLDEAVRDHAVQLGIRAGGQRRVPRRGVRERGLVAHLRRLAETREACRTEFVLQPEQILIAQLVDDDQHHQLSLRLRPGRPGGEQRGEEEPPHPRSSVDVPGANLHHPIPSTWRPQCTHPTCSRDVSSS